MKIDVFSDGGCKNNGRPDAEMYGSVAVNVNDKPHSFHFQDQEMTVFHPDLKGIEHQTSPMAEIMSAFYALMYIAELQARGNKEQVVLHTDCEDVVGWLTQNYKIKAPHLREPILNARNLLAGLNNVRIVQEPREVLLARLGH